VCINIKTLFRRDSKMCNKRLKGSLITILIVLLVFTLIACSTSTTPGDTSPDEKEQEDVQTLPAEDESSEEEKEEEAEEKEEEVVTLRLIIRVNPEYIVEENPILEELEKRTNTKLEIEAPPINNYNDRLNIVMASGDLPDVIYLGNTGTLYQNWARDGLLLKLDEYFEKSMPNAKKVLTEEELAFTRIPELENGLYSLPRVQTKPWDNIIYRKDWLEALGLEIPTTPKEFAEVMLAFTKNDPDGNGQNDTYGWSYNRAMGHLHRNLANGFGIRPNSVPNENGEYELIQAQPGYMEFVDWLREMYLNGSLDPEWYLTKYAEDDDKWKAGKIGTAYTNKITEHMTSASLNEVKNTDPNAELVAGPPLRQEGKTVSDVYYNPQIWGNWGISADSEHIERAVAFLDYGYTDECNELLVIGMEGVTYTSFDPETRFAIRTPEQQEATVKYTSTYISFNFQTQDKGLLFVPGSTEEEFNIFMQAYDEVGKQTNRITYLPESILPGIRDVMVKIEDSGINTKYEEYETNYICGQISREEFVKFIENEYIPAHEEYMNVIRESGLNK
jgi:ABC-type glycerol-3-phosphate transport system substrate-binding protein